MLRIKVENAYSDGHESTEFYFVEDVPADTEEMWDMLWEYTGDGHGADNDLGFCYEVTIVAAGKKELVGLSREWSGS